MQASTNGWRLTLTVLTCLTAGLLAVLLIVKLWTRPFTVPELRSTLGADLPRATFLAFHPDGRTLVSGDVDGSVRLWDIASGELRTMRAGNKGDAVAGALSRDGVLVAAASSNAGVAVRLCDRNATLLTTFPGGGVLSVAFHPEGNLLATGCTDGTIRIWDIATEEVVASVEAGSNLRALAFSPDGKQLATGGHDGGEGAVKLWNVSSVALELAARWEFGPFGSTEGVAFGPDGRTLVGSGSIWSSGVDGGQGGVVSYDRHARQEGPFRQARGTNTVYCVAFSPEGAVLAGGCHYGSVVFWDARSGSELARVRAPEDWGITSLAFSPDGKVLATASIPRGIRIWDVRPKR